MKILLVPAAIVLILSSCQDKTVTYLIPTKDVVLDLPNAGRGLSFKYSTSNADNELFAINKASGKLWIVDIHSGSVISQQTTPFKRRVKDYYPVSQDSIYYIPEGNSSVILQTPDTTTQIFNIGIEWFMSLHKSQFERWNRKYDLGRIHEFVASPPNPFRVVGSHIIIPNSVDIYDLQTMRPYWNFEIRGDSIIHIDTRAGRFPENYQSKDKTLYPFIAARNWCVNDKEQLVFSFACNHELFVYDLEGTLVKKKHAASSKVKLPEMVSSSDLKAPGAVQKVMQERFITESYYAGIFYDPYRKLYYRIAKLQRPLKDKDGLLNKRNHPFSLMILDEDFNLIGEQPMSGDYKWQDIFPTPEGVLIRKQDKAEFTLFQISLT